MTLRIPLATWRWRTKDRVRRTWMAIVSACRDWMIGQQRKLRLAGWLGGSLVGAFGLLALADPYVQAPMKTCAWGRGWFGCVLANHESLSGGCFTLVAALVAWAAVQEQLRASAADRQVARAMLIKELEWQAEIMGAAWGVLSRLEENAPDERNVRCREAAQYACERISQPEAISRYRQMAALLSWDERTHFETLLDHLEQLQKINWDVDDSSWPHEARGHFAAMSYHYEFLVPNSAKHFEGLWRRMPKAMTPGDWVRRIAGEN
jgi:hypothetical protein